MTESLTERLRQRAASQTAETETILKAELSKLSSGIRQQLTGELSKIQRDITATSLHISTDLTALKWASRYWWIALIATWLILGGFLTWLSMRPPVIGPMDLSSYQTFTEGGRKYLIVPVGSQVVNCTSSGQAVGCVLLPRGE